MKTRATRTRLDALRAGLAAAATVLLPLLVGCSGLREDTACALASERASSVEHAAAWRSIGSSAEGRDLLAMTLRGGPRRVYLVGSIHGNEVEGLDVLDDVLDEIRASTAAGALPATVRILRDANPDGTFAGTRANSRGVDLNRNWPASNFLPARSRGSEALSEPETRVLHENLADFGADLVIVLHSISANAPFVNLDGPAWSEADAFARAAAVQDARWHVRPSMGYATPGSLGTFVGKDRGVPILTIEFVRGQDAASVKASLLAGLRAVLVGPSGESGAVN